MDKVKTNKKGLEERSDLSFMERKNQWEKILRRVERRNYEREYGKEIKTEARERFEGRAEENGGNRSSGKQ